MKHVLRTVDKKKVVVEIDTDTKLYDAPTLRGYTRGVDIYAHKAQSGAVYFYTHTWSRWQTEYAMFALISREKAEDMLTGLAGTCGDGALTEREIAQAKTFGFDILEETA